MVQLFDWTVVVEFGFMNGDARQLETGIYQIWIWGNDYTFCDNITFTEDVVVMILLAGSLQSRETLETGSYGAIGSCMLRTYLITAQGVRLAYYHSMVTSELRAVFAELYLGQRGVGIFQDLDGETIYKQRVLGEGIISHNKQGVCFLIIGSYLESQSHLVDLVNSVVNPRVNVTPNGGFLKLPTMFATPTYMFSWWGWYMITFKCKISILCALANPKQFAELLAENRKLYRFDRTIFSASILLDNWTMVINSYIQQSITGVSREPAALLSMFEGP